MSRQDARSYRRKQAATFRSTFIPMPPDPTVDVEGIERAKPLHGYASIFWGFIATVVLVIIMVGVGLIAVAFS